MIVQIGRDQPFHHADAHHHLQRRPVPRLLLCMSAGRGARAGRRTAVVDSWRNLHRGSAECRDQSVCRQQLHAERRRHADGGAYGGGFGRQPVLADLDRGCAAGNPRCSRSARLGPDHLGESLRTIHRENCVRLHRAAGDRYLAASGTPGRGVSRAWLVMVAEDQR